MIIQLLKANAIIILITSIAIAAFFYARHQIEQSLIRSDLTLRFMQNDADFNRLIRAIEARRAVETRQAQIDKSLKYRLAIGVSAACIPGYTLSDV